MIIQIISWVFIMYGILSFFQDLSTEFTYKKYNKNIKVYICINDFQNEIENVEREISRLKWQLKNISINVVNYDEKLTDIEVQNFFKSSCVNIISKEEFLNVI